MTMRTLGKVCVLLLVAVCAIVVLQAGPTRPRLQQAGPIDGTPDYPIVSVHDPMRQLWTDHCIWVRNVMVGMFNNLKGTADYEQRLLENVKQMQELLVSYYGDGGAKFGLLFEQHIVIGGQIVGAIKSGDQVLFRSLEEDWHKNAQEITELLCSLNPAHLDRAEMSTMWQMHLDTVLQQAFSHKDGDSPQDVVTYDMMQNEAIQMADYLSNAMDLQFGVRGR